VSLDFGSNVAGQCNRGWLFTFFSPIIEKIYSHRRGSSLQSFISIFDNNSSKVQADEIHRHLPFNYICSMNLHACSLFLEPALRSLLDTFTYYEVNE